MNSGMRLRSVKFKNGGEIRVLKDAFPGTIKEKFLNDCSRIGSFPEARLMAGYAIVTWSADGCIVAHYNNTSPMSRVSGGDVPRFVHDVLVGEMGRKWAQE